VETDERKEADDKSESERQEVMELNKSETEAGIWSALDSVLVSE
jgi:hypothetical protein